MNRQQRKDSNRDTKRVVWRNVDLDRESRATQNDVWDGFKVYGVPWNVRRPVSEGGQDRTVAHCG